jgi:acyl-CoA thioesterase-1
LAKYPQLDLSLVNTGVSGDTIADMEKRWEQDCLTHRLDILSVLVGINDLWRSVIEPHRRAAAPKQYEVTYDQLLSQAKEQCHCQIVLMEPFLFTDDLYEPLLGVLQPYLATVHALATKRDAVLLPLQQRLNEQIVRVPPARWSQDSAHPYLWAHAWIAQRWLEATGL